MVTFDATTTVTSAREWLSDPRWPRMEPANLSALRELKRLVVFAAHPDDETLGAGGVLAMAGELSLPVRVVVATGNDRRRHDELESALNELGVSAHVDHLGFPDGALKHHTEELALAVSDIVSQSDGPTWAIAPWPGDRHGDHRTLGRAVENAKRSAGTEVFFYPVWLWQWGTPDECPWDRMLMVPLSESIRLRKQAALKQFTSQTRSSANREGVLTLEFLEHFRGDREVLIVPTRSERKPAMTALDGHFEGLHSESGDPWAVRTRWYERRKRAITMASLPRERFARALEVGCSIGEVSAELAHRCEHLLAIDGSESAVTTARNRLAGSSAATVQRMRVPYEWPQGCFDLIVLSEVAYYLTEAEWRTTIQLCRESLVAGGVILLCHWLGVSEDFAQTGEQAHRIFRYETALTAHVVHRDSDFVLEVFAEERG